MGFINGNSTKFTQEILAIKGKILDLHLNKNSAEIHDKLRDIKNEFFPDKKILKQLTTHRNLKSIVMLVYSVVNYVLHEPTDLYSPSQPTNSSYVAYFKDDLDTSNHTPNQALNKSGSKHQNVNSRKKTLVSLPSTKERTKHKAKQQMVLSILLEFTNLLRALLASYSQRVLLPSSILTIKPQPHLLP